MIETAHLSPGVLPAIRALRRHWIEKQRGGWVWSGTRRPVEPEIVDEILREGLAAETRRHGYLKLRLTPRGRVLALGPQNHPD